VTNPKSRKSNGRNGGPQANVGYEEEFWKAANTLRDAMTAMLEEQFAEPTKLEDVIRTNLKGFGYGR